jgi:hypothetical protein
MTLREMTLRKLTGCIAIAGAICFGTAPAWTQNEGATLPNRDNAFTRSGLSAKASRPTTSRIAHAAPRRDRHAARPRSPRNPVAAIAPQPVAPELVEPAQTAWPNAQDNVGAAGLIPVVVKTVREMVQPPPENEAVHANELSEIDLGAGPILRSERIAATDGRASVDEEPRIARLASFADTMKTIGSASWLEPLLLLIAGAMAAAAAMRVFAA